ncbi:MAG: hypothetical protein ACKV19_24035 [Verrucomicrobiales bacterium]
MKPKPKPAAEPSTQKAAAKKPMAKKAVAPGKKARPGTPTAPLTEPLHMREEPFARGEHTTADRHEIREISHRVMGSRQSQRPAERHDQPRKKR